MSWKKIFLLKIADFGNNKAENPGLRDGTENVLMGDSMTENIMTIFNENRELLRYLDRAVVYFREGEYEQALSVVSGCTEAIRSMTDAVLQNREYFRLVSTDAVVEMLEGIVKAQKSRDYVLLADLLELQMMSFICSVQELIVDREDFCAFDEQNDIRNRMAMQTTLLSSFGEIFAESSAEQQESYTSEVSDALESELEPEKLLEGGYRVEFTACGEMTVAVNDHSGESIYLHTNHHVSQEAFMLAKKWAASGAKHFILYGFGMGYIVREMLGLLPADAELEVYESDVNLLKLACAFTDVGSWITDSRLKLIYDKDCNYICKRLQDIGDKAICVHYPSLCHTQDDESREMLMDFIPWARRIEKV